MSHGWCAFLMLPSVIFFELSSLKFFIFVLIKKTIMIPLLNTCYGLHPPQLFSVPLLHFTHLLEFLVWGLAVGTIVQLRLCVFQSLSCECTSCRVFTLLIQDENLFMCMRVQQPILLRKQVLYYWILLLFSLLLFERCPSETCPHIFGFA